MLGNIHPNIIGLKFLINSTLIIYLWILNLVGVWIGLGLVCAGIDLLTETNSKPQIQSIVR